MTWFGLITLLINFPLLPRSCQKSEPQVNQISWMYWTFRVNSETKIKLQKNKVFFIKAISTRIPMFLKPEICFQSFFGKIRVFQSFSPIHKKTLIRWKFDSVIYGACAVWCMTLLVFVVFLSRRFFFFKKNLPSGDRLVPVTRVRILLSSSYSMTPSMTFSSFPRP